MIGKIKGKLDFKDDDYILIDVNGLCYTVYVSDTTLSFLPNLGEPVAFWTELIVRQDFLQLIGFASFHEREWYRLLVSVQGVGAKAALKILGRIPAADMTQIIASEDAAMFQSCPGIGPKLAKRIVSELKGKISNIMEVGSNLPADNDLIGFRSDTFSNNIGDQENKDSAKERKSPEVENGNFIKMQADALSALNNLGYYKSDAASAISIVCSEIGNNLSVSQIVKLALQRLVKKE